MANEHGNSPDMGPAIESVPSEVATAAKDAENSETGQFTGQVVKQTGEFTANTAETVATTVENGATTVGNGVKSAWDDVTGAL